tara:strand:- start:223 stop:519 length:297 start_codon:yes stop_codon:yes gene_type:complete
MELKDFAVPGITVIFAAGVSFASFESSAKDVEDLSERLNAVELSVGKQEVVDVKIEGIEKRLDKMEDIVQKMLDIQQRQAVNIAQICQATNANCSSGN